MSAAFSPKESPLRRRRGRGDLIGVVVGGDPVNARTRQRAVQPPAIRSRANSTTRGGAGDVLRACTNCFFVGAASLECGLSIICGAPPPAYQAVQHGALYGLYGQIPGSAPRSIRSCDPTSRDPHCIAEVGIEYLHHGNRAFPPERDPRAHHEHITHVWWSETSPTYPQGQKVMTVLQAIEWLSTPGNTAKVVEAMACQLAAWGHPVPDGTAMRDRAAMQETALLYLNLERRRIAPRPRTVRVAASLRCPNGVEAGSALSSLSTVPFWKCFTAPRRPPCQRLHRDRRHSMSRVIANAAGEQNHVAYLIESAGGELSPATWCSGHRGSAPVASRSPDPADTGRILVDS